MTRGGTAAGTSTADARMIFCGVSLMRQLPSPSAVAWLFDLGDVRGPWVVVLRDHEDEARERLAEHLVELGQAADVRHAYELLENVEAEHAGVVW